MVLPLEIKMVEDRINDSINAFDIDETDHWSSSPSNLYKAALDHVSSPKFSPELFREGEEGQQFRQIFL